VFGDSSTQREVGSEYNQWFFFYRIQVDAHLSIASSYAIDAVLKVKKYFSAPRNG